MNVLLIDVRACARCEQNHPSVVFRKQERPIDEQFPWWGTCPLTGEPILLARADEGGAQR